MQPKKDKYKYYYFPKIPLEICTPSNAYRHIEVNGLEKIVSLRNDPSKPDSYLLPSLKRDGQLDPLFVNLNIDKNKWIVEPGQGRWYCLKYLDIKYTFILVRIDSFDEESMNKFYEDLSSKHVNTEIKTFKDALPLFKATNKDNHTGPGYMKRRGWFRDTVHEVYGKE